MPTRTRLVACVPWDEIEATEAAEDVVEAIHEVTGEDYDEVRAALSNGTVLPLVEVAPVDVRPPLGGVSRDVVGRYARDLRKGAVFPPVVVDSSRRPPRRPLLEGRHRTLAALWAGVAKIDAFDLAAIRVAGFGFEGKTLERYEFPRCEGRR